ncbi:DinB family protein [Alicyclobacillus fructus]|uniref:DinB family protein n=1 Tax=Alicyclobacillus fructus TaxID=2816082 RepID=UPI001A8FD777|nr:DinB family protein [Alicyclobacillus fructus]
MDSFAFVSSTHRQTLSLLDEIAEDELNVLPGPERWTVGQIFEHILKTDLSIIPVFRRAAKDPRPYSGKPKGVERAADRRVKIKAPDFITPSEAPKVRHSLRAALEEARQTLMDSARAVGDPDELEKWTGPVPHPVFGELSLQEWLEFVGYHEQRHLEQARETLVAIRSGT